MRRVSLPSRMFDNKGTVSENDDTYDIIQCSYGIRTGQTAVASIPRRNALSGLLNPQRLFADCASNAGAFGLRNTYVNRTPIFYKRGDFPSQLLVP
jgi:hypothetical protein